MPGTLENEIRCLDQRLLARHRYDTELFDRLTERQRETGILHGGRPLCRFLRPYFLRESKYHAIKHAAKHLNSALSKVAHAALTDDSIADELGVTDKELRWARIEPGYSDVAVTSRLDTFLTETGFAFLEYNGENPAGVGDQTSLEQLFQEVDLVNEFQSQVPHYYPQPHARLLDEMVSAYRASGGQVERPNIAIVDWQGVDTSAEFEILSGYFEDCGHQTRICDPNELEYRSGRLVANGFEIDIFYKRVIIHEFLERCEDTHALYRAFAAGSVCMINSFRAKLPHKKSSFAILSDERYKGFFSEDEIQTIRQHIPWTRKVREERTAYDGDVVDLINHIHLRQESLVLKPNDDYGGHGVKLGWTCTGDEWQEAIALALTSDYVVQERVPGEPIDIPAFAGGEARMERLNVDFDPFLFRGEVEGGMVRLAPGGLVNVTQGGGETALAIIAGV